MSNYDWFDRPPPEPKVPEGSYYRWTDYLDPLKSKYSATPDAAHAKAEILARELKALEIVVQKLAEDFYEQCKSSPIPKKATNNPVLKTPTEQIAELQAKITSLEDQISDLTAELDDVTTDRDYWQREAESNEEAYNEELSKREALEDKLSDIRGLV